MKPFSPPDLSTLRDIQLPDSVSWWPPGPAWWVLAALLLCLLLLALYRRYRRHALRRAALHELGCIRSAAEAGEKPQRIAMALSTLLRRVALARFPQQQPAGLTGERWLAFLDRHGTGGAFRNGVGRSLLSAPYARSSDCDCQPLLALAERWIRGNT